MRLPEPPKEGSIICSLRPRERDGDRGDGGDSVISKAEVDIDIDDDDVDEVATQLARMDTGISCSVDDTVGAGDDDELGQRRRRSSGCNDENNDELGRRRSGGCNDEDNEAAAFVVPLYPQEEATAVVVTPIGGPLHASEEIHFPITHDGDTEHKTPAWTESSRPLTHDSCSRSTSASVSVSVSAANMLCPNKSPEPQQRVPAPPLRQVPLSLRTKLVSKKEEEDDRMRMPSTPFFCHRPDLIRVITFEQAVKELREHIGSRHMEAS